MVICRFGLLLRSEKSETHSITDDPADKISTDWMNVMSDLNDGIRLEVDSKGDITNIHVICQLQVQNVFDK